MLLVLLNKCSLLIKLIYLKNLLIMHEVIYST